MKVNIEALVEQCIRWGAVPCIAYHTRETAHKLLERMPTDQRVHLQWICDTEWQLIFDRTLVTAGSFEDCVTALAKIFTPAAKLANQSEDR